MPGALLRQYGESLSWRDALVRDHAELIPYFRDTGDLTGDLDDAVTFFSRLNIAVQGDHAIGHDDMELLGGAVGDGVISVQCLMDAAGKLDV